MMFAKSFRGALAVLGLAVDEDETPPRPAGAIADLDLDRPAEAFEALRRIVGVRHGPFDLAA
jgi:hypothetical protein